MLADSRVWGWLLSSHWVLGTTTQCGTHGAVRCGSGPSERDWPLPGGELAACGGDVGASVGTDRGVDAEVPQPRTERRHALGGSPQSGVARGRVERDEVHVCPERQGQLGKLGRVLPGVVDAVYQRPLE